MFKRVFLIILDSVGIGELPDAKLYGDNGSNTIANIAHSQEGLFLPTLSSLGLGNIINITGVKPVVAPKAFYGKMAEISKAKDTTSGHWEIAGCPVFEPFPTYPEGFPQEVIERFTSLTGLKVLGNKVASGTEIIKEYGAEHIRTGYPIIYTSADSVFQIAAHEDIIPLNQLYDICKITREKVCINEHRLGRVIARPFIGEINNFIRTTNRHDYSIEPYADTMFDILTKYNVPTLGVGKISDIFTGRGIKESHISKTNDEGMAVLDELLLHNDLEGLIMANLVDFDSLYGHRNDIKGYARALERFDGQLILLLNKMNDNDLLIITADHGCDPTTSSTDHSREYVPLIVHYKKCQGSTLGTRTTFADISATILENFKLKPLAYGTSFLKNIIKEG